jgi:Ca2+-binding EF-hand superfamily protein
MTSATTTSSADAASSVKLYEMEELKEIFHLFDPDGTGRISVADVRSVLSSSRLHEDPDGESPLSSNKSTYMTQATQRLLQTLPPDAAGNELTMTLDDFVQFMAAATSTENNENHVFGLFDKDNKGFIDETDLMRVSTEIGEDLQDFHIREMLVRANELVSPQPALPSSAQDPNQQLNNTDKVIVTPDAFAAVMDKKLFS